MMDLETPRVPQSRSPVHWDRIQVAIRQRAPTVHQDFMRTESTVAVDGRWIEFHRVFGPREKNQKVLDFAANAIRSFRNGNNGCIIGFGHHDNGVSWTLGTNPTSNGLVPSIYRYLQEEKLNFRIMAEWISTNKASTQPAALGTWQTVLHRQDLKHLLQDVSPPPQTHLIIWFSLIKYPKIRLAVVDLCNLHYPLARHVRQNPLLNAGGLDLDSDESHDNDKLISQLHQVTGPRSAIVAIGCISDSSSPSSIDSTLNYALSIAGRLPAWASHEKPLFELSTPDDLLDKESPVLVTPTSFGESLMRQNSQATTSPAISDVMQEHATISANDEYMQRLPSPARSFQDLEMSPEEYYDAVQKCRLNTNYI